MANKTIKQKKQNLPYSTSMKLIILATPLKTCCSAQQTGCNSLLRHPRARKEKPFCTRSLPILPLHGHTVSLDCVKRL